MAAGGGRGVVQLYCENLLRNEQQNHYSEFLSYWECFITEPVPKKRGGGDWGGGGGGGGGGWWGGCGGGGDLTKPEKFISVSVISVYISAE